MPSSVAYFSRRCHVFCYYIIRLPLFPSQNGKNPAEGRGFTGAWAFPLDYSDADRVSDYAYEALCWMTMNGVITGMGDGTLAPRDNATRAQIAAMFMRFTEKTA